MGTTLAKIFGLTDILGVGAPTVLSVALLILLCFGCGRHARSTGTIILAQRHDVVFVLSVSANDLNASLKQRGAGLARLAGGGRTWLSRESP